MEAPAARGGARMRLRLVSLVVVVAMAAATARAQLQVGYYDTLCPAAEIIVQQEVSKGVSGSPGTAAGLLRLHFHDCFVRGLRRVGAAGLDAGQPGGEGRAAKLEPPRVRGDRRGQDAAGAGLLRRRLLRRRARLRRQRRPRPGRRQLVPGAGRATRRQRLGGGGDQREPAAADRQREPAQPDLRLQGPLPGPDGRALRAHTVGMAQCSSFSSRLYSYGTNGGKDPSMDPAYLATLTTQCPQSGASQPVAMDPVTPNTFDTNYYANVAANRGLLASDQALLADNSTAAQVLGYTASPGTFQTDFASAMVAMGAIGVLTDNQGTIRTNCRVVG
ncbi:unnamed protein product [Triticum turgidum subsp. durum]|uniref:Peroxidase n=1 Tax=Triticum turgidum subsp. durum TaxID=4567 RepID=A0A9R0TGL2_TRITD|nr:unnamed protein product [Triticum turgidum subsp. durum]